MQLNTTTGTTASDTPSAADGLGIDAVGRRLQAGHSQLTAIAQELAHRGREWREQRAAVLQAGQRAQERLAAQAEALPDPIADVPVREVLVRERHERWAKRIAEVAGESRRRLRNDFERERGGLSEAGPEERAEAGSARAAAEQTRKRLDGILAEVGTLRTRVARLDADVLNDCRKARAPVIGFRGVPAADPDEPIDRRLERLADAVEKADGAVRGFRSGSAFNDSRLFGILLNHVLLVVPFALAAAFLLWGLRQPDALPWVGGAALVTQALVPLLTRRQRRRLGAQAAEVRAGFDSLNQRLTAVEHAARAELDPQGPLNRHLSRFAASEEARTGRIEALRTRVERALAKSREREKSLRDRLAARAQRVAGSLRTEALARRAAQNAESLASAAAEEAAQAARLAEVDGCWAAERARLSARWAETLAGLRAYTDDALARSTDRHPAWSSPSWAAWSSPRGFPTDVPVGTARLPLAALAAACGASDLPVPADAALAVPLSLAFPSPAALLLRAGPDGRERALRVANQVLLRALASFPAGRLRLTLIDPIGLGEAFSGFLDLAEHDEALLGDGVLNDASRIEQGLADLIAHVETVIQKRLRGRYATIEDYNRDAGEMQEPLHLVAVADFPAGFGERAIERLATLARTGTRCGVHLLVLHDDRRQLPPALDLAWFRRTGIVLRDVGGRLTIDNEALHEWEFDAGPEPTPALRSGLLAAIGKASGAAQRVEVPFSSLVPPADAVGTWSTAKSLRIPIGKCGADRLQYLELGRGTAQHVLVGGRTGSGKSTLFHVLITAGCLWHSPRELEFHLIDFKKGVEFKGYAANRLPHARIIAIESDREFGLSVLRHLDAELTRRGDLFRKAGAQDLAAHRATGGEHIPRTVLLIDEFQEFFTEDDAIARDAALLLDRFVRQGRAFGLHVVLGSQTLGGAYSMAKSSLGQMGVRIALPCNEADAHLLLHEDNDGARLLTRPGDGIYNDRAGMAEGNSPFQVCWLPEEEETTHLRAIAARAAADGWRPVRPTVVFEGDAPARLDDIAELAELAGRAPRPEEQRLSAWIGQSSSLKGPAELSFPAAAGGNLLLVGPNREAAAATCGAILLEVAVRHPRDGLRLHALDGEDDDAPFAVLHGRLRGILPAVATRQPGRDAAALLQSLEELLEKRRSGDADRTPVVLTVFSAQRLRQLRPDEDLAFDRDGAGNPAERFARLLADGPEFGIHTMVWCDSLASVQRGLGRRALKAFDARILFQMSASDSTELIDADDASRLGLHTALLVTQGDGRSEKFRPFSLPDSDTIERLEQGVRGRAGG